MKPLVLTVLAATTILTGCVPPPPRKVVVTTPVYRPHVRGEVILVDRTRPPAPRHEVCGRPPYPGARWVPGQWVWEHGTWVWHRGHWAHRHYYY